MNDYIDSTYYFLKFGGKKIPHNEIKKYATKASNVVRNRILNKDISSYQKLVQDVTCEVAELLYSKNQLEEKKISISDGTTKVITSEKVGDYSRNIATPTLKDLEDLVNKIDNDINKVIDESLFVTGLLYGGINVR